MLVAALECTHKYENFFKAQQTEQHKKEVWTVKEINFLDGLGVSIFQFR